METGVISWKQTLRELRADLARRRLIDGVGSGPLATLALLFKRGVVAVVLYRLSRYCLHRRLAVVCRLLTLVEFLYTKDEISPHAAIGPGLVLGDGGGIGITRVTVAGRNCTFLGCNSITLGAMEDFDVERDRIVIGDHCVFGPRARVMRPLSLANGTQVKANSIVLSSTQSPGMTLSGIPARRRASVAYEDVVRWNPLRGGFLAPATSLH
jgi:serine acetyltransferase